MTIIGIDPGPTTSGLVVLDGPPPGRVVVAYNRAELGEVLHRVPLADTVVIEWLTSYGTAVGASVLDTARVVGRIEQAARTAGADVVLLTRPEVALRLVGSRRATNAQIHERVRDIYRAAGLANGGGADPCRGTKAQPGPLHDVRSHAWDALAVALAWRV